MRLGTYGFGLLSFDFGLGACFEVLLATGAFIYLREP